MSAIQALAVRKWYSGIADSASPLQAAKAYRLLRTILNSAIRDGVLAINPCNIEGPAGSTAPIDLAEAIDDRYRAVILLIAFGPGSRRGEFRAFRRRHVDLLRGRILSEAQEQDGPGGVRRSAPKNDSARWTVLPPFLVEVLGYHMDHYSQPGPDGYLFTGPTGGPIANVHWYKSFHAARDAVGMPELHPHDLRHAAGTLFAQQSATVREIITRLGHRSRAASDRYQHAAVQRDAELAAKLEAAAEAARARRQRSSA